MSLSRPVFTIYRSDGEVDQLFCKVCGSMIGRYEEGFGLKRLPLYAELKMRFTDGSYHVTNGCIDCLSRIKTPEQMHELHQADLEESRTIFFERDIKRVPDEVVVVNQDGRGTP